MARALRNTCHYERRTFFTWSGKHEIVGTSSACGESRITAAYIRFAGRYADLDDRRFIFTKQATHGSPQHTSEERRPLQVFAAMQTIVPVTLIDEPAPKALNP